MITTLAATEKLFPNNCTRLGSIPRFGASPITRPIRHQLAPTITIAPMPNQTEWKNGSELKLWINVCILTPPFVFPVITIFPVTAEIKSSMRLF